ncbi:MAG TPA: LamG-like jellyroll fold domain-containing protein, partial [Candidatus Binatia bacterium]|nr:LamG-like jellyroll fold domain-containing protein [Candidatus Binatia bacterium]
MKCRGGLSRQVSFVFSLLAAAIGYQTKAAADTFILTWVDSSTNESGFQIERKTGSAGTYAQIATVVAKTTSYVDGNVTAGITYCYRVRAFNSAGVSVYSNEACGAGPAVGVGGTPPPGLVAAYSFNEGGGTTASDASGNGHTGTVVNSPTWTTGKVGSALLLNGTNQYVDVPSNSAFNLTGDLTVAAWVKDAAHGSLLAKHNGSTSGDYAVYIHGSGIFDLYGDGLTPAAVSSTRAIPADHAWHHVAVTRQGSTVTFYLDGSAAGTASMAGAFHTNSSPVDIGCDETGCNDLNGLLTGSVDEVRLYNRALSASEIQTVMNTAGGNTSSTTATSSGSSGGTSSHSVTRASAGGSVSRSGNVKIGFFRPSTGKWYLDLNGNGVWDGCQVDGCLGPFGQRGNFPIVGDWAGTGTMQIGIFDATTGLWKLDRNGNDLWDG